MRMRTAERGRGVLAGAIVLGLILLGMGLAEAQTKSKLSMGTATIGGLYYIFGGAWAKALNEAVPDVDITAESTPGSVANSQMIQAGKIAIGFSQATAAYEAYNGIGWTKGTRYDKIRALVALYPAALTIYTLDSRNIRSLKDLNDKNVSLGPAGAGVDQFGRNLFEVLGIKPKRIHNLPHEQTAKAVGDGQLDAGMTVQLAPWPGLKDLETTHKLYFVPLTKEEVGMVRAKYAYYAESFLPKGSYKAITADIPSLGDWNLGIVGADMSGDLAYKLTKATFAKQKDLLATHRAAEYTTPQNAKYNTIPIHPGAVRFYKEAGVEIPAALLPPK
jgi:TRAP transporter TAXI family solute receptor